MLSFFHYFNLMCVLIGIIYWYGILFTTASDQSAHENIYTYMIMMYHIVHMIYSKGEEFEVTPQSSITLFYPPTKTVTISGKLASLFSSFRS